jgi:predicted PurR-regulated permease PerM
MRTGRGLLGTITSVLIVILIFLVAWGLLGLIAGLIIAILFYLFWHYYRKAKTLEREKGESGAESKMGPPSTEP